MKEERLGVAAAVLSSVFGGLAVGATRYLAGRLDPAALGSFRFGIGTALLVPFVIALRQGGAAWPNRRDWPATIGLGLLFFALFPILFNLSLRYTTAARGALALSSMPLLTMLVAAAFDVEALTRRKTAGVLLAIAGVAAALVAGLTTAPATAWQGDLVMIAAALCMALYSVGSRAIVRRSSPLGFTTLAMAAGAVALIALAAARDAYAPVPRFGAAQWLAIGYLGLFGGAICFLLWAVALGRTTPTRVAISVAVNPIAAAAVGVTLLGEPLRWSLAIGVVAVLAGITLATTDPG
jgi:drug/metabolite transporter (DMT)-like permease